MGMMKKERNVERQTDREREREEELNRKTACNEITLGNFLLILCLVNFDEKMLFCMHAWIKWVEVFFLVVVVVRRVTFLCNKSIVMNF